MKKVLVAGAALMLVSGIASTASAAEVKPGVVITGDARLRLAYKSEDYVLSGTYSDGGTSSLLDRNYSDQTNMDTRVRINFTGTAAGGTYVKARIRAMETMMGDMDRDNTADTNGLNSNNLWADLAYFGIPFNDNITIEAGKYRSTYGPLPLTNNFFYDDVHLTGFRGILKFGDVTVNPFIEWMDEAQNTSTTASNSYYANGVSNDVNHDNDEIRYGVHVQGKINKDWIIGGMVGYQNDERSEINAGQWANSTRIDKNDGFFGSIYTNGKWGNFGLVGELAVTEGALNGMTAWTEDSNSIYTLPYTTTNLQTDVYGSDDTGWGGYLYPNFTIDKLNIGVNMGFTDGGFIPDRAYGFVMIGSTDNSAITAKQIGAGGDWLWAGLVANYQINESLKLTGNLVYADVDPWTAAGEGPGYRGTAYIGLDSAWELSAVLKYTISKGTDVYFSAGYLDPSYEYVNQVSYRPINDDGIFGALTRIEIAF
jgi:hypothetical protein